MSRRDAQAARRAMVGSVMLIAGFVLLALMTLSLHVDDLHWRSPGGQRWTAALLVILVWLALVGWMRSRRQPLTKENLAGRDMFKPEALSVTRLLPSEPAQTSIRVVYASQTGFAEQLVGQTLRNLRAGGLTVVSESIESLDLEALHAMDRVLFIVSTTGDGDPPDSALAFHRAAMRMPADLARLRVGLLALGDRDYEDFCGFGRELWHWLQLSAAQPLFEPVEVDRGDEAALQHWQHHLAMLSGNGDLPDWRKPAYQSWSLVKRRCLNPGSLGAACFHLELRPPRDGAHWEAGDLVEVGPCHGREVVAAWSTRHLFDGDASVNVGTGRELLASLLARCRLPHADGIAGLDEDALASTLQRLPHREYSVASVPEDGAIHLLVRQMSGPDGQPGIGSSWLCTHAPIGTEIALRVRSNPNFHAPPDARPLILIGNGTGIAALRSLIKARVARGQHRNWLVFGERQHAHDFHYRDEIEEWMHSGRIERVDFAWSRDQVERIYVPQQLRESEHELHRWVDAGAAIYVCGSLEGMAPGVDSALRDMLGAACVERLREQGRYRRDVY